jgi:hypothetical protein
MTPEQSFSKSTAHLDDALEYLTFAPVSWTLEETWRGVAWALNALRATPLEEVSVVSRGSIPSSGELPLLLDGVEISAQSAASVDRLEALVGEFRACASSDGAPALALDALAGVVFDAWAVHDEVAGVIGWLQEEAPVVAVVLPSAAPSAVKSGSELRMPRRAALRLLAAGGLLPLAACARPEAAPSVGVAEGSAVAQPVLRTEASVAPATVRAVTALQGLQWPTTDPFLFCAYHTDDYPEGNEQMGPAASLEGRDLGRDFEGRDNWRMYHGEVVPGFPRHPHRGFETVTVVRRGLLDHTDSMGATARFGDGDVQWLTAGGGIQHAEMFPLLRADAANPLELFQIWLNLPARDKMVDPYFTMLWHERIPKVVEHDEDGRRVEVIVNAGVWRDQRPESPPPNSWASKPESDLAIWTLKMDAGARVELPLVQPGTERSVYAHRGAGAEVAGVAVPNLHRVEVVGEGPVVIVAGSAEAEILLLQGRPIGEPVARRGPFVMNTNDEIRQAYADYQQTGFGGWPWSADGPVHERERGRFARHVDGREEEPV